VKLSFSCVWTSGVERVVTSIVVVGRWLKERVRRGERVSFTTIVRRH